MLKTVVKQGHINSVRVIVVLCHHAMGLANKNVSSKRKGDVECLRQLLNRDTLTQSELVVLCKHTIRLANKNVSSKKKGDVECLRQ